AQLQRLEVEPPLARDDALAVDDTAHGKAGKEGGLELGEVAIEGFQVAALEVEPVAVAEHDRAEPVPLRLEEPAIALGQLRRELRQHRLDRRLDRDSHPTALSGDAGAAPRSVLRPTSSRRRRGAPARRCRSPAAHGPT